MKTLRSDLTTIGLLATFALFAGLLLNHFRSVPLPLIYKNKAERLHDAVQRIQSKESLSEQAPPAQLPVQLTLEEFSSFVDEGRGTVIDTRPRIFYGLGHVPGALSVPRDDFEAAYAAVKEHLEINRFQAIVIYCGGPPCESSLLVKNALSSMGFTNLSIFEGGWNAWTGAKKREETTP